MSEKRQEVVLAILFGVGGQKTDMTWNFKVSLQCCCTSLWSEHIICSVYPQRQAAYRASLQNVHTSPSNGRQMALSTRHVCRQTEVFFYCYIRRQPADKSRVWLTWLSRDLQNVLSEEEEFWRVKKYLPGGVIFLQNLIIQEKWHKMHHFIYVVLGLDLFQFFFLLKLR